MSSTIDQAPLGPERLPQESPRAYRAFCIYRDLGPDRSLDQAWKRFCAASDPTKDRGSARRPGHWAAWSQKYQWVERAEAYDDVIEEENRSAAAERRRKLHEARSKFQSEEQQRIENQVRNADAVLDRMGTAPLNEVIQLTKDNVTNKTTTTKIKAVNARDMAALLKARNQTASQAIRGVFDITGLEQEEQKPTRIVWTPSKKAA
jgi:uncharacterized membrane protein